MLVCYFVTYFFGFCQIIQISKKLSSLFKRVTTAPGLLIPKSLNSGIISSIVSIKKLYNEEGFFILFTENQNIMNHEILKKIGYNSVALEMLLKREAQIDPRDIIMPGEDRSSIQQDYSNIDVILENGSLLVMKDTTQTNWMHRLPPTKKVNSPRINLTFRQMHSWKIANKKLSKRQTFLLKYAYNVIGPLIGEKNGKRLGTKWSIVAKGVRSMHEKMIKKNWGFYLNPWFLYSEKASRGDDHKGM